MRKRFVTEAALVITLLAGACAASNTPANKPLLADNPTVESVENKMEETTVLSQDSVLSAEAFETRVRDAGGQVGFVFGDDRPFAQCHASTLTQAPDGSFIAAWFAGTEEKHPDVGIWMSRFDGAAWTPPQLAAKVNESAHWNPVLFTDAEKEVHLFFKVGPEISHWATWWMTSTDNGLTWSEARELVPGDAGGRGPVRSKPIILSDGSWLAPASTEFQLWEAFVDRSSDRGSTWERSADFEIERPKFRGKGAIQPTLWESTPGVVHALLRTGAGRAWRTDSQDFGRTWSPVYDCGLPNNNSGIDVLKLEEGTLMLVLNPVGMNWGPRTPLSLAVSRDNGATWRLFAHFEDDPPETRFEFSYPAIVRTRDGIAVCYTHKRERVRCWMIPMKALQE